MKAEVFRRIADNGARSCPFVNLPNSSSGSHWGLLRHPKFVGIREDKKARDVIRETAREQS